MSLNFSILGHEGVVEVINHLRPDTDIEKGDRITFHVINCCNKCENCREGLQQKCTSLFKVTMGFFFFKKSVGRGHLGSRGGLGPGKYVRT